MHLGEKRITRRTTNQDDAPMIFDHGQILGTQEKPAEMSEEQFSVTSAALHEVSLSLFLLMNSVDSNIVKTTWKMQELQNHCHVVLSRACHS